MKMTFAFAASLCALAAAPAMADITIFDTPGAVQPDENVLFHDDNPPVGNMAFGLTNQTSTEVTFLGVEPLATPSGGQARIEAADGGFNTLQFFLTDTSMGFTEVEFDIHALDATSVDLNFTDQFGNIFSDTFALGNGQNFFSAQATNDQLIYNVSFTMNGDATDVRQVRIGGFAVAIPEPATWAMLFAGFGAIGYSLRRSKGRRPVQAV